MRHYDLVIFDFDGTLADSFALFIATFNKVAAEIGFTPFDLERLDELRNMTSQQLVALTGIQWWRMPAVARRIHSAINARIEEISLFDGVQNLLVQLHALGVRIAVVSSNDEANVRHVLGPQLCEKIAYFSCGASFFGKQRRLIAALYHCRTSPARALSIGDETRDVEAARQAGIAFAGVEWGYASPVLLGSLVDSELLKTPSEVIERIVIANAVSQAAVGVESAVDMI